MSLWRVFDAALGGLIAIGIAVLVWHVVSRFADWLWFRDEMRKFRERSAKKWPGVVTSDGKPTNRYPSTKDWRSVWHRED